MEKQIKGVSESLYNLALWQMYNRQAADEVYNASLFKGEDESMAEACLQDAEENAKKAIECLKKVQSSDLEAFRHKKLTPKSNLSHNDFRNCIIVE